MARFLNAAEAAVVADLLPTPRDVRATTIADREFEPYRLSARMRTTPDYPVSSVKSVGQELRDARERKGERLDDVWRAIKIRPYHLAAIEEGRFQDLPSRALTIGYVSRYARYLGSDIERLSERLEAEIGPDDGSANHRVEVEPVQDRKIPVRSIGVVAAGFLFVALSADDLIGLTTSGFERAAEDGTAGQGVAAPVPPAIERQVQVVSPELLSSLPFEVAAPVTVSLRPRAAPSMSSAQRRGAGF
jgi:hypothetical protein